MKIKNTRTLIALLAGLTLLSPAFAQDHEVDRAGRSEFYLLGQWWTAEANTVPNVTLPVSINPLVMGTGDLHFKFDDTFMYGFGFAYNFNDKFATLFEFTFGQPE